MDQQSKIFFGSGPKQLTLWHGSLQALNSSRNFVFRELEVIHCQHKRSFVLLGAGGSAVCFGTQRMSK